VIASVFNPERSKLIANAGWIRSPRSLRHKSRHANNLKAETPRVWDDEPFDAIPFYTAMEYLKEKKPRILYLSLGETDDWAHEGKYVEYLDATHRVDAYLQALWEQVQSMPEYRGNTTLIFSPDHGRGKAPHKWKDHGQRIPDSKYIWMAFLGPIRLPWESAPIFSRSRKVKLPRLCRVSWRRLCRRFPKPASQSRKFCRAKPGHSFAPLFRSQEIWKFRPVIGPKLGGVHLAAEGV